MKTFNDLKFYNYDPLHIHDGLHAKMYFSNGYGISVIRIVYEGRHLLQTSDDTEWEIAVLFGDEGEHGIKCHTDFTRTRGVVVGYLKEDEVTEYMRRIQEL